MTYFVFFLFSVFPRRALYDYGLDARTTRQAMLHHKPIPFFSFSVFPRRALYDYGLDARTTRQTMLHHKPIRSTGFFFATPLPRVQDARPSAPNYPPAPSNSALPYKTAASAALTGLLSRCRRQTAPGSSPPTTTLGYLHRQLQPPPRQYTLRTRPFAATATAYEFIDAL